MNPAAQELLIRIAEYLLRDRAFCERVGADVDRQKDSLSDRERGEMHLSDLIESAGADSAKEGE